jgi:hypothetical protein
MGARRSRGRAVRVARVGPVPQGAQDVQERQRRGRERFHARHDRYRRRRGHPGRVDQTRRWNPPLPGHGARRPSADDDLADEHASGGRHRGGQHRRGLCRAARQERPHRRLPLQPRRNPHRHRRRQDGRQAGDELLRTDLQGQEPEREREHPAHRRRGAEGRQPGEHLHHRRLRRRRDARLVHGARHAGAGRFRELSHRRDHRGKGDVDPVRRRAQLGAHDQVLYLERGHRGDGRADHALASARGLLRSTARGGVPAAAATTAARPRAESARAPAGDAAAARVVAGGLRPLTPRPDRASRPPDRADG